MIGCGTTPYRTLATSRRCGSPRSRGRRARGSQLFHGRQPASSRSVWRARRGRSARSPVAMCRWNLIRRDSRGTQYGSGSRGEGCSRGVWVLGTWPQNASRSATLLRRKNTVLARERRSQETEGETEPLKWRVAHQLGSRWPQGWFGSWHRSRWGKAWRRTTVGGRRRQGRHAGVCSPGRSSPARWRNPGGRNARLVATKSSHLQPALAGNVQGRVDDAVRFFSPTRLGSRSSSSPTQLRASCSINGLPVPEQPTTRRWRR